MPQSPVFGRAESELTRSVISGLSFCRLFSADTCASGPIEHVGARGAELPFVCNKALGYTTRIRDCILAKPHRIRRTCIGILLRIGDCRERSHDRDYQNNSVQFAHNIRSNFRS